MHAWLRFALDETLVNPDALMLKSYKNTYSVPLSCGRASIWTLLPALQGSGNMLTSILLQRCQSLPIDAAKFTAAHDLCVAATENAEQCDQLWLRFAEIWLPRCNASFDNPGFVFVDGHSSHVTRGFIEMCAKYSIYVIVELSHTSILLQVTDVGINRFLKETYERECTSDICTASLTGQKFENRVCGKNYLRSQV